MRLKFLLITLCCLASVQLSAQKANTTNSNDTNATPTESPKQGTIDKEHGCIFPTAIEIKKQVPNPMYHPGNSVDGLVLQGDFLRKHPTRMK